MTNFARATRPTNTQANWLRRFGEFLRWRPRGLNGDAAATRKSRGLLQRHAVRATRAHSWPTKGLITDTKFAASLFVLTVEHG